MSVFNIKWLGLTVIAVIITVIAVNVIQAWQSTHFDCSGDMLAHYSDGKGDVTIRYIFSGDRGVAILRGEVVPDTGARVPVNQNVWFSFTRKGSDYFLRSENVSASTGTDKINPVLLKALPEFYLLANEPFYLSISRLDSRSWQFYTSRAPSVFCQR
jgi:hypothetical protein